MNSVRVFDPCLQLTKKEVKQIADIFLRDVFKRADEKGIKIEVTEKFKDRWAGCQEGGKSEGQGGVPEEW